MLLNFVQSVISDETEFEVPWPGMSALTQNQSVTAETKQTLQADYRTKWTMRHHR